MNPIAEPHSPAFAPSLANLRSLLAIRAIALLGQAGVLAWVLYTDRATQSVSGLAASLLVLAAITVASLWRSARPWQVSHREFLAQLLVDVVGWTVLMYCSGGADNPFVSYFIVPVVVAAAVLPWRFTWLIAGASVLAYSTLLYYRMPFPLFSPHASMAHGDSGGVHRLGMWFNFLFSVGLITYFVVRMAAELRTRETRQAAQREQRLRHDQILAVASLAAGTAHELGTPLSTMTVVVDEMLDDPRLPDPAREDCTLLQQQLLQCRHILADLSQTAEASAAGKRQQRPVAEFVEATVQHWAARRPRVSCSTAVAGTGPQPQIAYDQTLPQALENLLNNAADTGSPQIRVTTNWNEREARIEVRDWGPGAPQEVRESLSAGTDREGGLGIGLILSRATAERHGGRLQLDPAGDQGTVATLALPLNQSPGSIDD
ncbi:HAMP domain-containing histidine kinase [Parahaliea maris]|uniref:histidine kinase n=1 Tax=Parahaliea maris TaxID=2716870 RepID=A0A5C9A6L1_9GAMM|nr:ATP-binding protein [Parahaliea maris]TXS96585.1 HAMP domain-containing histidine kinase [Parahaliea maris]